LDALVNVWVPERSTIRVAPCQMMVPLRIVAMSRTILRALAVSRGIENWYLVRLHRRHLEVWRNHNHGCVPHYPTGELADIKVRDVQSIAAPDCVLVLWATAPIQPAALAVMAA
jgi:hypothetical protein